MIFHIFLFVFTAHLINALTPNQKINATVTKIVGDLSTKVQVLTQEYINDQKTKRDLSQEIWDEIEVAVKAHSDDLMNRFSKRTLDILLAGSFKVVDTGNGKVNAEAIRNTNIMIHQLSKAWVEEVNRGNGIYRRHQFVPYQIERQANQMLENAIRLHFPHTAELTSEQIFQWLRRTYSDAGTILKHDRILHSLTNKEYAIVKYLRNHGINPSKAPRSSSSSEKNFLNVIPPSQSSQHIHSEVSPNQGSVLEANPKVLPETLDDEVPELYVLRDDAVKKEAEQKIDSAKDDVPENQFVFGDNADTFAQSSDARASNSEADIPNSEAEASNDSFSNKTPKQEDDGVPAEFKEKNEHREVRFKDKSSTSFWGSFKQFFQQKIIQVYTMVFLSIGFFYMIYDLSLDKFDYPELIQ